MKTMILFEKTEDCCGCGVCANSCPQKAIRMERDEFGFLYPAVDAQACVGCDLCKKVCGFQNQGILHRPGEAYAVQAKDEALLKHSASGGVFALLAQDVLKSGGVAVGCALVQTDEGLIPRHIVINREDQLQSLQGSKYVQSVTGEIYSEVRGLLKTGRQVLFCGTPCQVDALKRYLGTEYSNLLTADLICHGVPNDAFFRDYVRLLEKQHNATVTNLIFRDKSSGWSLQGRVFLRDRDGKEKSVALQPKKSAYYKLFLRGETYRSSCYHCKYARMERAGDLTLGDFWGIERRHPECLQEQGGKLSEQKGISCVLVNTAKGKKALESIAELSQLTGSDCDAVARENHQLKYPSTPGKHREKILRLYRDRGYPAVDAWFTRYDFGDRLKRKFLSLIKK